MEAKLVAVAVDPTLSLDAKAVYLIHVTGGAIVDHVRPDEMPRVIAGWKELTAANYLGPF